MIPRYKINSLTDEEFGFLSYCLSEVYPPKPINFVDHSILSAYDKHKLNEILNNEIKPKLNENGIILLSGVQQKLCN